MKYEIHTHAEIKNSKTGKWSKVTNYFSLYEIEKEIFKQRGDSPFYSEESSIFAFLANVENYDSILPLTIKSRGLPKDVCKEIKADWKNRHFIEECTNPTFIYLNELNEFDYDRKFITRNKISKKYGKSSSLTFEPESKGTLISYRDYLGEMFFKHLQELNELGDPEDVRIIFWFIDMPF